MRKINYFYLFCALIATSACNTTNSKEVHTLDILITPVDGGTVSPSQGKYESGERIRIEALPSNGWSFVRWEGNIEGHNNPVILTMDNEKNVTAVFAKDDEDEEEVPVEDLEERQISFILKNAALNNAADGVEVRVFTSSDSLLAQGKINDGRFCFIIEVQKDSNVSLLAKFSGIGYINFEEMFENTGSDDYNISIVPAPIEIESMLPALKPGGSYVIDVRDYIDSTDPDDGKSIPFYSVNVSVQSANLGIEKRQDFIYEFIALNNASATMESVLINAKTSFNKHSQIATVPIEKAVAGPVHFVIMPLGDSHTNDTRSRVKLWHLLTGDGHSVTYVGDQYQESTIPESYHEGVGGITIQGVLDKAAQLMTRHKPDYINLMIGTNDIAWYFDETGPEIAFRWNELVQNLFDHSDPDTWIVAATIPPVTSKAVGKFDMPENDRAVIVKDYNSALRNHVEDRIKAGDNIVLADMEAAITLEEHISEDGVHLNDDGQEMMGKVYYNALNVIQNKN